MARAPGIDEDAVTSGPPQADAAPQGAAPLRVLVVGSADGVARRLLDRLARDAASTGDAGSAGHGRVDEPPGSTGAARYVIRTPHRDIVLAEIASDDNLARAILAETPPARAALLVVDASIGIVARDRTSASMLSAAGIQDVTIAIDGLDRLAHDRGAFERLASEILALAARLGIARATAIPTSAASGENVVRSAPSMPWCTAFPLLAHLESVAADTVSLGPLRLMVEHGSTASAGPAGPGRFDGTIVGGTAVPGDRIAILPAGVTATIAAVEARTADAGAAGWGQPVTVALLEPVDVPPDSIVSAAHDRPEIADQFAADIVWLGAKPMLRGRPYGFRLGLQSAIAQITDIRYVLNPETAEHAAGRVVPRSGVARCHLSISSPAVMEPFSGTPALGAFLLLDRTTGETLGAGRIVHTLRRAQNIHWQAIDVTAAQRASLKAQRPCCLWLTGLSGSGKSTVSNLLEKRLFSLGHHTYVLDGDNVRHGLNRDLGFTEADRVENIRRVAEVARLMVDAGLITIVSFISPFRSERRLARERFDAGVFIEVFVDAPLEVCEERDPKGLYLKARSGALQNFTGISSPYEPPEKPDLHLRTSVSPPEVLVEQILGDLRRRGIVTAS